MSASVDGIEDLFLVVATIFAAVTGGGGGNGFGYLFILVSEIRK